MPTHVETAKGIVHEWFRWADAGGYIGHLDVAARLRLEAEIAKALSEAATSKPSAAEQWDRALIDHLAATAKPKPKRKPKGDAA